MSSVGARVAPVSPTRGPSRSRRMARGPKRCDGSRAGRTVLREIRPGGKVISRFPFPEGYQAVAALAEADGLPLLDDWFSNSFVGADRDRPGFQWAVIIFKT